MGDDQRHDGDPTGAPDDGEDPRLARSAEEAIDAVDVRALDALARALAVEDPVPPGLVERATFAVALEELEVEVATLQRGARAAGGVLAGVRGTDDHTLTMTFTATALSLTLAVVSTGRDRHRVDGWVTTERPDVWVVLRLGDETTRTSAVEDGRFVFVDVPPGMVQVVVESSGEDTAMVVTPVFEL